MSGYVNENEERTRNELARCTLIASRWSGKWKEKQKKKQLMVLVRAADGKGRL